MKTRSLLSLLVLGTAMTAGAAAHATDCSTDADCASGEYCAFADAATPCIPEDPNCGTGTPATGICTTMPTATGECSTDADCPDGLACEEIGGSACATPACPPGEPCPEPTPCEPTIYYGCVAPPPPPCAADSDCADGLACIIETFESCSGGGAIGAPEPLPGGASDGSGTGTGTDPVVDCTTETYSYCAPRWMGPCTTAADCGDGFTCEPELSCACSGSGGTDVPPDAGTGSSSGGGSSGSSSGSAGGTPTPAPDGSGASTPTPDGSGTSVDPCGCEPTGTFYCALPAEPTVCETAADCPTDWSCEELPSGDATCSVNADGTTDCPEPTFVSYCLPPHWREAIAAADAGAAYTGSRNDALGGGTTESATSPLDNLPGGAADAAASGAGTGGEEAVTAEKKTSSSGCSSVGSTASTASLLLSLVGLALLRRRRATR